MWFGMNANSGFSYAWHDDAQSILLLWFPRYFNVQELRVILQALRSAISATSAPHVDFVLILDKSQIYGGTDLLAVLHSMTLKIPQSIQSIIYVNPSALGHMLTKNLGLLNPRYRQLVHYVDTTDEALALIDTLRGQTMAFH